MIFIKGIIVEWITLIQCFVMWIPFWPIRWLWLKIVLKELGKNVYVARNVDLRKPSNVVIGNNSVINKSVLLDGRGGLLYIGANVDIAQECMIWTLTHDVNSITHSTKNNNTIIEHHVWLGARSIILPGVTIHEGAVVGAGALVHKDIEPLIIVSGNPCRVLKRRNNPITYKLNHHRWFI